MDFFFLNNVKIARKVAHLIFNSRIAPWKQSHFLSEWHRLMPGVGKEYEPNISLLKGIAIGVKTVSPMLQDRSNLSESDELYWKYFPNEALPLSVEEKFKMIFKEQSKWKSEDLLPYFEESQFDELLMRYTTRRDGDDASVWYEAKQVI